MSDTNRENTVNLLFEFIDSDTEKVVLLKGTHQFEKHSLVLAFITQLRFFEKGVFRSNSLQNIPLFMEYAGFKNARGKLAAGQEYILQGTSLYFDSVLTRSTWSKTPTDLDFALVYPMDVFRKSKEFLKEEFLDDLFRFKNIKKIFLVTFTDVQDDYSWLNEYVDRTIIFDAEDEDPDYHQRVLNFKNT